MVNVSEEFWFNKHVHSSQIKNKIHPYGISGSLLDEILLSCYLFLFFDLIFSLLSPLIYSYASCPIWNPINGNKYYSI